LGFAALVIGISGGPGFGHWDFPLLPYNPNIAAEVAIAPEACLSVRKVRTAQGTVLGNAKAARADGKCNRKIPLWETQNDERRTQNKDEGISSF